MNKKKITIVSGIITFLAACALIIVETFIEFQVKAKLAFGIAERVLLVIAVICGMSLSDYKLKFKPTGGYVPLIAGLFVVFANFPLECLIRGSLVINEDGWGMLLFVLSCVATGIFEEIMFRGLLFSLIGDMTKKRKYGEVEAILLTSVLFGLTHLMNLFVGANPGATFLQVGYSFLIGCMCNVVLVCSKSMLLPIILHTLFNIGGTLTSSGVASGSQWDDISIIIMAVISVIASAVIIFYYFKRRSSAAQRSDSQL